MKITNYKYADGNGNVYIITQDSIEYIPITKEQSSSGFYSGGEPAKKQITQEEYQKVKAMIGEIVNKKSIHIKDRIMTSGMISALDEKSNIKPVIFEDGPDKDRLEELLKLLLRD